MSSGISGIGDVVVVLVLVPESVGPITGDDPVLSIVGLIDQLMIWVVPGVRVRGAFGYLVSVGFIVFELINYQFVKRFRRPRWAWKRPDPLLVRNWYSFRHVRILEE